MRAIGDLAEVPAVVRGAGAAGIPARVPGCVHTDLMAAGLIGDPAVGLNELEQQWIGRTDWEYRCRFEADEALFGHERIDLVCEGLDTIATVELNGVVMGAAANMFHPHRFHAKAGAALRRGENELVIRFKSPIRHIREEEARLGPRPRNGDWDPFNFIRKAACNFGWDWGPKVATSGIWKSIRLEGWSGARIAGVRPLVRRLSDRWVLNVEADLDWASSGREGREPYRLMATLTEPGGEAAGSVLQHVRGESSVTLAFEHREARVWWPAGKGERALYGLSLELQDWDGPQDAMEVWNGRIGFREVRLDTSPVGDGAVFKLEVNGKPIFCKGANWIPEGLFPARMTRERYRQRLQQAADANMNMLRVWGGGFYESDDFYELCDEMGILVWQDFMFACAMYPEEEPFPTLIEAEARHQITRLSSHPSVALWCGGNECTWGYESWGWKERLKPGQTWGRGYWLEGGLLPRLVKELDPTRPYWPNSPWSGGEAVPSNDADRGDRHTWDVKAEGYRTIVPRFCSEFGHQAPATYATLVRAVGVEGLKLGSRELDHRQRGTGGTARHIGETLEQWFRPPRDLDEWHYLSQLAQARALRMGIEWMRVNQPRCMGALLWQLNDAWPGLSWSLVDSDGRRKLAWYAVRDAMADTICTIQERDGRPMLFAVNDRDHEAVIKGAAYRVHVQRGELRATPFTLRAGPLSVSEPIDLQDLLGKTEDPRCEFLQIHGAGAPTWFFAPDREVPFPAPLFDLDIRRTRAGASIVVKPRSVLRDLVVLPDGMGSGVEVDSRGLLGRLATVFPPISASFDVVGALPTDAEVRAAIRCANQVGSER